MSLLLGVMSCVQLLFRTPGTTEIAHCQLITHLLGHLVEKCPVYLLPEGTKVNERKRDRQPTSTRHCAVRKERSAVVLDSPKTKSKHQ